MKVRGGSAASLNSVNSVNDEVDYSHALWFDWTPATVEPARFLGSVAIMI
jgi:hypothetical protein